MPKRAELKVTRKVEMQTQIDKLNKAAAMEKRGKSAKEAAWKLLGKFMDKVVGVGEPAAVLDPDHGLVAERYIREGETRNDEKVVQCLKDAVEEEELKSHELDGLWTEERVTVYSFNEANLKELVARRPKLLKRMSDEGAIAPKETLTREPVRKATEEELAQA